MPPTHWKGQNGLLRRGETYVSALPAALPVTVEFRRKAPVTHDRMPDLYLEGSVDELIQYFSTVLSTLLHVKERQAQRKDSPRATGV